MIGNVIVATALGVAVVLGTGAVANAAGAPMLVKYKIVDENSIPESLTAKKGDPANGRKLSINRKKGNCLACHVMPIPEQSYHGKIGPDLNGIASRYDAGELRLRIVNPKIINEETIMPAFYRNEGFHRVMKKFKGKTIISAQDVEDIVAYLMTLK
ncbi:MAG: sulfur oxidation c-type cytochrome SoxX [Alphaproteobacteria bacterium]|nr:sulfur oxidation c-type cytochrome SoxX [Alphaproteobacteria bacterium]